MSSPTIDSDLQRLHHLAWQPGARMHVDWWLHLGLDKWQSVYQSSQTCRPSIDKLIVHRRQYAWKTLPAQLSADQKKLLALEPRFFELIVALGIIGLNCLDHLLIKTNRQALMPYLTPHHCNQLLALHRGWSSAEKALSPETLVDTACQFGTHWWKRDANDCPISEIYAMRLPIAPMATFLAPGNAVDWLIKIGRFL